jgi:hypothetical protein
LARTRQLTAVDTRGGSRMRESRTYGSVRGARGNSRPYREGSLATPGELLPGVASPLGGRARALDPFAVITG